MTPGPIDHDGVDLDFVEVHLVRTTCPAGGKHEIEEVRWFWGPSRPLIRPVPGRACVKCGLRDTYIQEEE